MKIFKRTLRFLRILIFAFMFAVCMVMGVAPVIPKRKVELTIEVIVEDSKENDDSVSKVVIFQADQ